jgi:hypothetical protein
MRHAAGILPKTAPATYAPEKYATWFLSWMPFTSIFYLHFKENNENNMAAHAIYFDFYYCQQQSTMAALPAKGFADTRPP